MPDHTASRDHAAAKYARSAHVTQAAALLRAPVATLRYWRHLDTGSRSSPLGRRVLYRRGDLRARSGVHGHHDGPDAV